MSKVASAPRVSVVILSHDRPHWLRESVLSVQEQTYQDWELIISDDSREFQAIETVVHDFQDDPRIRLIRSHYPPAQINNARAGLEAAKAPYVALRHDDDIWEPDLLEALLPPLEADPSLTIAFADHWLINAKGKVLALDTDACSKRYGRANLHSGTYRGFIKEALIHRSVPIVVSSVFRRESLDISKLEDFADPVIDYWLTYLLCKDECNVYYVPRRLARYRVHGGSITGRGGVGWITAGYLVASRLEREPQLIRYRRILRCRRLVAELRLALYLWQSGKGEDIRQRFPHPGAPMRLVGGLSRHIPSSVVRKILEFRRLAIAWGRERERSN